MDRIVDSVLIWENKGQKKPVSWHNLRGLTLEKFNNVLGITILETQTSR